MRTKGVLIVGTGIQMETAGKAIGRNRCTEVALRTTRESLAQLWLTLQPVGYRRTSIYVCLAIVLVDVREVIVCDTSLYRQAFQYSRKFLTQGKVGIDATVVVAAVTSILRLSHRVHVTRPDGVTSPLAILALHCECSRRKGINHIPKLGRVARSIRFCEHTEQVHLHRGVLRENHIHIHAKVTLHIFIIGRISLVGVWILDETIVILQVEQGIVFKLLTATSKGSVQEIGYAVVAEGLIHPVYVRIEIWILA